VEPEVGWMGEAYRANDFGEGRLHILIDMHARGEQGSLRSVGLDLSKAKDLLHKQTQRERGGIQNTSHWIGRMYSNAHWAWVHSYTQYNQVTVQFIVLLLYFLPTLKSGSQHS
jgi:hypothetical protein